jgi:hypothetical protein
MPLSVSISICSIAAALWLAPCAARAQPVVPLAEGQVKLTVDGVTGDPRNGGAINLSLVKIGALQSSSGALLGDGSVCPEADRLVAGTVKVVCPDTPALLEWYKKVLAGTTDRKSGSVILLDREGSEVVRKYNLFDCFPVRYEKYEGGDCDDTADDSLVEMELQVAAVQIMGRTKPEPTAGATRIKIEIGAAGHKSTDAVSDAQLCLGVRGLTKGEQPGSLKSATTFAVLLGGDDDCDDVCDLVLQSQGKPAGPVSIRATVPASATSGKNVHAPGPPPTTLSIDGARIRRVTFPTFQVVPGAKGADTHIREVIEFVVEKVERA